MSKMSDEELRQQEEAVVNAEAAMMIEDETRFNRGQDFKAAQAQAFQTWWETTQAREFAHRNPKVNKASVSEVFRAGYKFLWDELPDAEPEGDDEYKGTPATVEEEQDRFMDHYYDPVPERGEGE